MILAAATPSTNFSEATPPAVSPQTVHGDEPSAFPLAKKDPDSFPLSTQNYVPTAETLSRSHDNTKVHSPLGAGSDQGSRESIYDSHTSSTNTPFSPQQRSVLNVNSADISPAPKCFESSAGVSGPLNRDNPRGGESQKNLNDDGFFSDDNASINMKKIGRASMPRPHDDSSSTGRINLMTFFSAPAELSSLPPSPSCDRVVSSSPCAPESIQDNKEETGSLDNVSFIRNLSGSTYTFSSPEDGIAYKDADDASDPGKPKQGLPTTVMYWSKSDPVEYSSDNNKDDNSSTDTSSIRFFKKSSRDAPSPTLGIQHSFLFERNLRACERKGKRLASLSSSEDDFTAQHHQSVVTQGTSYGWQDPSPDHQGHHPHDLFLKEPGNTNLGSTTYEERSSRSTSSILRFLRNDPVNESRRQRSFDDVGGYCSSSPASLETSSNFKDLKTYDNVRRLFAKKKNTEEQGAHIDDDNGMGHAKLLSCADTPERCSVDFDRGKYVDDPRF